MLQGFYQSHQATAAAVQVNNIHILRGMLGKPGCGMLQMNGQPTAREHPRVRRRRRPARLPQLGQRRHVADLARVWNIEPMEIPHYAPPTHAMQIFRYAEEGSIRFL